MNYQRKPAVMKENLYDGKRKKMLLMGAILVIQLKKTVFLPIPGFADEKGHRHSCLVKVDQQAPHVP